MSTPRPAPFAGGRGGNSVSVDMREVNKLLRDLGDRTTDLSPVFMGPVDRLATSIFERQFASEGAFGGQRWPALKRRTLRTKAKLHRQGMGILRRFNRLWGSLVKSGGPDSIRVIRPRFYQRGTAVPYAGAHQNAKRKGTPVRQLVPNPLPAHVVNTIGRLVRMHIEGAGA